MIDKELATGGGNFAVKAAITAEFHLQLGPVVMANDDFDITQAITGHPDQQGDDGRDHERAHGKRRQVLGLLLVQLAAVFQSALGPTGGVHVASWA